MSIRIATVLLLAAIGTSGFAQTSSVSSAPVHSGDLVPAHPATAAQLHEFYVLTHALEQAHTVMSQMVTAMQSTSAPYLPTDFWNDLRSAFEKVDLEAAFLPAYQKYFSQEDMQQVIDFYRSPAGQRLLVAQPLISSVAGDMLRKEGERIGLETYQAHKAEIDAAKAKYDASQIKTVPAPAP